MSSITIFFITVLAIVNEPLFTWIDYECHSFPVHLVLSFVLYGKRFELGKVWMHKTCWIYLFQYWMTRDLWFFDTSPFGNISLWEINLYLMIKKTDLSLLLHYNSRLCFLCKKISSEWFSCRINIFLWWFLENYHKIMIFYDWTGKEMKVFAWMESKL